MAEARVVYRAPYAIPALGAEAGDFIVVRAGHESPVATVKHHDRRAIPAVLPHLDRLTMANVEGDAPMGSTAVRAWLLGATLTLIR